MSPLAITLVVLVVSIALLLSERIRPDLVALMVIVSLAVSGVLTQQEAFSGFSRSAVMTILAVFILAEGLMRAGVADRVGTLLLRVGGRSEARMIVAVMLAGAFLSLFMNNIAAASLLVPAVVVAARRADVSASRLLMPLAFGTILGGMATLFTTTNLVASGMLTDAGFEGFGALAFAPLGFPLILGGTAYVALWGRRLLPVRTSAERQAVLDEAQADLVRVYKLDEKLFRVRIPSGSTWIDRCLSDLHMRDRFNCAVLAIQRDPQVILSPSPDMPLRAADALILKGDVEEFRRRDTEPLFEILASPAWTEEMLTSPQDVVVEAMLAPRSTLIGKTVRGVHFRGRYGFNVLAIWRAGEQIRVAVRDERLQFGDALLLAGPRSHLRQLRDETDFIVVADDDDLKAPPVLDGGKRIVAVGIFGITFAFAAAMPDSVAQILLGGAVGMVLFGVLAMEDAYRAIDWKSIFLVAGLLPLGLAMGKTGAARWVVDGVVGGVADFGPVAVLAALCGVAALLTQAMNGAAATAVVLPVALQAATALSLDPRALAMGVAISTSMAFLTPLGSPVNILVMGQGGYRFRDYARLGAGLFVVVFGLLLAMLPLVWPLSAR